MLTRFWRGNWPDLAWSQCPVRCPEAQRTHCTYEGLAVNQRGSMFIQPHFHKEATARSRRFWFSSAYCYQKSTRNQFTPKKCDRADFNSIEDLLMMLIGFWRLQGEGWSRHRHAATNCANACGWRFSLPSAYCKSEQLFGTSLPWKPAQKSWPRARM